MGVSEFFDLILGLCAYEWTRAFVHDLQTGSFPAQLVAATSEFDLGTKMKPFRAVDAAGLLPGSMPASLEGES